MPIKVIGAGLGRTGTLSLHAALNTLGYKTLHFVDLNQAEAYVEWAEGRKTSEELVECIEGAGWTATAGDNPNSELFADMLKRNPVALVILSVRDSPSKWAASWMTLFDTVLLTELPFSLTYPSFLQLLPLFAQLKRIRARMGTHLGLPPFELTHGWRRLPEAEADRWLGEQYEAHNSLVKATVPPERLLVFNVKEGWGPLCAFLGAPTPPIPFPNVNDTATMARLRLAVRVVVYGWAPALALAAAAVLRRRR